MRSTKLEMVDIEMVNILRGKSEAERLAIAFGMWNTARYMLRNVLSSEHPDWQADQIQKEIARRMSNGSS
jgi:hypothetical protein